jgi:4-diphosphocytidyl-2C-methyl-D-erythritol kinase
MSFHGLPAKGRRAGTAVDGTNLVVRAAQLWVTAQASGRLGEGSTSDDAKDPSGRGLSIALRKCIPVGAGLGGGSSDAARTLIALNRLDRASLSTARLAEMASRLGSDVPFFVHGPSSICKGRGELVTPVERAMACLGGSVPARRRPVNRARLHAVRRDDIGQGAGR